MGLPVGVALFGIGIGTAILTALSHVATVPVGVGLDVGALTAIGFLLALATIVAGFFVPALKREVTLDATIVRMLLVPATMELLGDRNWWLPRWLDRILPDLDVEGHAAAPLPEDEGEAPPPAEREPEPTGAEGGCADQSHLHRDVLTFTGATPAAVVGEPWLAVDEIAWAGPACSAAQ